MLSPVAIYGDMLYGDTDGSLPLTMTRSARRGPWLPEEDESLLELVRTQGANNWVRISQQIQHRSPKQCRERYHQNLKPTLKHDPISAQEGEVIERLVQEMGKRWAEIARRLGNRSDNAVKNWWNGSVNRRRRNPAQSTTGLKQVGSRLQPVPFTLPPERKHPSSSRPLFNKRNDAGLSAYDVHHDSERQHKPNSLQTQNSIRSLQSRGRISPSIAFDPHSINSLQSASGVLSNIASSRPSLTPVHTWDLRPDLPPIRSSSFHVPLGERASLTIDRPPISPALSDTSQRHAPSLVSDTQSSYSISPGSVTTPRTGLPIPTELRTSIWPDGNGMSQHNIQSISYKHLLHIDSNSKYGRHMPVDPTLQRIQTSHLNDEKFKDSRMNVSTLLQ